MTDNAANEVPAVVERCSVGDGREGLLWDCPGCGYSHLIPVEPGATPAWHWNGDLERPTLSPSVHVRWEFDGQPGVCHFFLRWGQVEFLSDCTHALAGQVAPLGPVE